MTAARNGYNAAPLAADSSELTTVHTHPLPYSADNSALFAKLRQLPHPVLLDSSRPGSERGRYDILCAAPLAHYTLTLAELDARGLAATIHGIEDKAAALLGGPVTDTTLPFTGGIVGWLGYDAGLGWQRVAQRPKPAHGAPALVAGIYNWAIIADHEARETRLVMHPLADTGSAARILELLEGPAPAAAPFHCEALQCQQPDTRYSAAFDRIQHYIRAGDCYQINLAREFAARFRGDPWSCYRALRHATAAPFSAFLGWTGGHIISLSPERFLKAEAGHISTEPIKGTAPRHPDPATDRALGDALQASDKNRAENLMIVDLLRNDLGRVCKTGSVAVDNLFELQSFNTVHHLVSRVAGELQASVSPLQALVACFPGGSITGAPKRRAMEIIEELEAHHRGPYCGSIFYASCNGHMDSNIAIRSLQFIGDRVLCHAGGGIVADSDCRAELQESEDKISLIINTLKEYSE